VFAVLKYGQSEARWFVKAVANFGFKKFDVDF
jgi:hypothetical protein